MKKLLIIMLASILLTGCSQVESEKETTEKETLETVMKSDIFGSDFFEDITELSLVFKDKVITEREDILEILYILQNVKPVLADESIYERYGTSSLEVTYSDGRKIYVWFSSELIGYNEKTYVFNEGDFIKIMNMFQE